MNPLRAYLLVRRGAGDWDATVHRDLESLMEAWRPFEKSHAGAIVHVGFWRPETTAFETITVRWSGRVLLTAPARYALPAPCAVAPCQAGEIEGLPLYVALEGWGYEITAEEIGLAIISGEISAKPLHDLLRPDVSDREDWCAFLAQQDSHLADEARSCGVIDEASYLSYEHGLPTDLRGHLGWARFAHYAGDTPSPDSIIDRLCYGPPWLLSLPLSVLDLSVRSGNCMREHSVATIEDLGRQGEASLLKFDKLGRKSLREIGEKVVRVFSEGPANPIVRVHLQGGGRPRSAAAGLVSLADLLSASPQPPEAQALEETDALDTPMAQCLEAALATGLALLDERETRIMRMRMGFDGKPNTLQEISDEFGVTRERIRQKEVSCVEKITRHPVWHHDLEGRLEKMLSDRQEPLPLLGLEILDSWFAGAESLEQPLDYALDRFCGKRFSVVRTHEQVVVSRLTQLAWDEAVKDARRILEAEVDRTPPESDARALVDAILVGAGEELRPDLWAEVSRWANFSTPECNLGERVLVSFGFGAESIVEAILMESDRPLHYTEIARRCKEQRGRLVEVRRAHQSARNVGLLFARGTYGLMKHFPLSESDCRLLVAEVEDLVEGGDTRKQWHTREIAEAMEERGLDFGGRLTPYVVSIALEHSGILANLGRMVWASRSTGARGTANRIDVHQAIVSLLRSEGHPMHSDEIRKVIARDRGLNCFFQIQPGGPLLRMGPGLWGLADRDLPFSVEEGADIVERLVALLCERGKGLHVSEIRPALESLVPQVAQVQDPGVFLGLAQRDDRCAVWKGQYVFLPEWGEPRRLTILESVRRALEAAGPAGLILDEAVTAAEALIERPLSRTDLSYACSRSGASYDETSMRWTLPVDEESEGEEDSDLETDEAAT